MSQRNRNGKLSDVDDAIKSKLVEALDKTGWKIHKAALALGIGPPRMYRLLRKFKLIKIEMVTVKRTVRKLVKA